ncbi:VCBS repeat-containing protein [Streptomyces sp. NPDC057235]|uniref:VCBS repeat-containing protein n=1 Tax=Streptomyces sp. NPDC057235 TaxID=3346058 RepID=UPI003632E89F
MSRPSGTLAAAVVTVLALTSGAVATAPAFAATASGAASASARQEKPVAFPERSEIVGAGEKGFLSRGGSLLWTDLKTGATTELPGTPIAGNGSDTVAVTVSPNVFRFYDMASGAEPVTLDLSDRKTSYTPAWFADGTLALWADNGLRLVSKEGDEVTERTVPGVRADGAWRPDASPAGPGEFAVASESNGTFAVTVVDIATGTATVSRTTAKAVDDVAASRTSVTWAELPDPGKVDLVVLDRVTGKTTTTRLNGDRARVDVLGGWALDADPRGLVNGRFPDLVPLTARSLGDPAVTVRLLDHASSSATAPDGSLLVRGGTKEHGEGLYRVSLDAQGSPVAAFVAGSGESAGLGTPEILVPETVTLDTNHAGVLFSWGLARSNVKGTLTLRHTASGLTRHDTFTAAYADKPPFRISYSWNGLMEKANAPAGAYTWEFSATPLNGVGDPVTATGSFTVLRPVAARHDFDGNGAPDVLARDAAGRLWRDDTYFPDQQVMPAGRSSLGHGWNVYDRIEVAGDLGGSATDDLVTRDESGGLWLYEGKGDGGFLPRKKIGTNWGVHDRISGGSDLNGDGKNDVIAVDKAGALWLYPGTGNVNAPLGDRKKIGTNWGIYNLVTATGNMAGAAPGDILARDKDGVLWVYLGNGDGTLRPRAEVGGGWGAYTHLVPIGNADRYGRPDLLAVGPRGTYVYGAKGVWNDLFAPRRESGLYAGETTAFDLYS